jgi:uncharacterized membrane protein YdjX (TVP38/TMEM64 family)
LSEKGKKRIGIAVLFLLLLFCAAVYWFAGRPMIRLAHEPEKFKQLVNSHGILGKLFYIGMVIFQVIIAFVPGEPLEIGAGYAFGALVGTILCVIGTVIGSVIVVLLVRKLGIKLCEVFFPAEKIRSLKFLQNTRKRNIIIFLLFFLPGTPKDLVTYFLGLTDIKISTVIFLASVIRLPSIVTSTLGGDALGLREYATALIVFAVTVAVSGIGTLIYKKIITIGKNKK